MVRVAFLSMVKHFPLFTFLLLFLFIKAQSVGIRLSDTNVYFYEALLILQGNVVYKDFFFSNFPLFAYIASLYAFLTSKNITLFYFSASIEVVITTVLIYILLLRRTKQYLIATLSALSYLFSFMVLATSDHQTGVFAASLFAVLAFLFWEHKRMLTAGSFLALSLLTKAYFLPVVAAFSFVLPTVRGLKDKLRFLMGSLIGAIIVLSPTLLLAPSAFFENVFGFSLLRPQGVSKVDIAWFFITKDPLFAALLLLNLLTIYRNRFFGALSASALIFFFLYKDTYYLYLNFLAPFLCLSLANIFLLVQKKRMIYHYILPAIVILALIVNTTVYLLHFRDLQKVDRIDTLVSLIKKENPTFLYGVNDITPALLLLTGTQPLEGVFDAHPMFFRRGRLNAEELTKKAISSKTIVIAHGASYPALGVDEPLIDEIFDREHIKQSCTLLTSIPVRAEGVSNRITLFRCY